MLTCSQRRALGALIAPEDLYTSVRRPPPPIVAVSEERCRQAVEGQQPTSAGGTIDGLDRDKKRFSWNAFPVDNGDAPVSPSQAAVVRA